MNAWISCAWALSAWTALGLAMERHHPQFFSHDTPLPPYALWLWRTVGALGLLLSLWVCWLRWSPSVAVAAWLGTLSLAGIAVALFWTYAPQALRYVAPACAALGLLGLWMQ